MVESEFAQEADRKEKLFSLFEKHEMDVRFKPKDKTLKYGFYDRIFNGVVEVTKVGKSSLRLRRENGQPLGVLIVTPDIARLSKKEDRVLATLGHRFGQWHLIHIRMIGSAVKDDSGEPQMHLSVSGKNPALENQHENI